MRVSNTANTFLPTLRTVRTSQTESDGESTRPASLSSSVDLSINGDRIFKFLLAIIGSLVLVSSVLYWAEASTGGNSILIHKLYKFMSVDLELNAPAFFSTFLLLVASGLLAFIAAVAYQKRERDAIYWLVLCLGFLAMSFDETAAVHERAIEPVRAILGGSDLGVLYFAWVVPAGILIFVLAIFFSRFLLRLPRKVSTAFILAGFIFVGAAVGLELLEGKVAEINGKENLVYIALATTEEALEMLSIAYFIKVLIEFIRENFGSLVLSFTSTK